MSKVIIFGSEGQDGRCLTELLLQRGCKVTGISRKSNLDLCNPDSVSDLIKTIMPDEVYYFAAFHHSSEEKTNSEYELWNLSIQTHLTALSVVLESIRLFHSKTRFFYAASSLVFGPSTGKLSETSPLSPDSPYAITKTAGMEVCKYYREKYKIFASVGILFNHESEFRASKFLSKKIVKAVAAIQKGSTTPLRLGNLSAQVDWGYARDYVDAMTLILKLEKAENLIISSGSLHTVAQFVEIAFSKAGLDYRKFVVEDPLLLQRNLPSRLGDHSKLQALTGWTPATSFDRLIEILLVAEGVSLAGK